jgi:hypothetical protein
MFSRMGRSSGHTLTCQASTHNHVRARKGEQATSSLRSDATYVATRAGGVARTGRKRKILTTYDVNKDPKYEIYICSEKKNLPNIDR